MVYQKRLIRLNKKGQFYLLAALILVTILVGFALTKNFTATGEHTKIYELSEELKVESDSVIEHGISKADAKEIENLMKKFTKQYQEYADEQNREFFFIFGNKQKITLLSYDEIKENVEIQSGKAVSYLELNHYPEEGHDEIYVKIGDEKYSFELKNGELFYFIISENLGEDKYIVTNQ